MNDLGNTTVHWWDKLGKPQYGGELVIRANRDIVNFDPYFTEALTSIYGAWMERLVADDWTVDPAEWDYRITWHPSKYLKGQLAERLGIQRPAYSHRPFTKRCPLAKYSPRQRPRIYGG